MKLLRQLEQSFAKTIFVMSSTLIPICHAIYTCISTTVSYEKYFFISNNNQATCMLNFGTHNDGHLEFQKFALTRTKLRKVNRYIPFGSVFGIIKDLYSKSLV
jgi:hypothetical protein